MAEFSQRDALALAELRRQFAAHGFDQKATGRIIGQLLWHVTLAVGGIVLYFSTDSVLLRIVGLLLSTAGATGVGTNTHTSSHFATSNRRWVNEALTLFGYPFFLGMSATFWWHKHVVVHHPAPNVIDVDDDADYLPWLAMLDRDVESATGFRRFYYEWIQWVALPFILLVNGFNMQRQGWIYLVGCLRDPSRRKPMHAIDLACLVLHLVANLGIPMIFVSPADAAGGYALRIVLMGYSMFAVLGPGHVPGEAARLTADLRASDYLLRQTATTVNFRTRVIGRSLCSGLEYQIEHHLFPHISHVHYRALAPLVEDFCRQQGLPYRTYSWPVAIWKCWSTFRHPRPVRSDLESLRLPRPSR